MQSMKPSIRQNVFVVWGFFLQHFLNIYMLYHADILTKGDIYNAIYEMWRLMG